MKQRVQEPLSEDRLTSIQPGFWISLVVVVLVMSPSVYRLISEPFHWGNAAMVTAGMTLSAFHIVRLVHLKRTLQGGRQQ